MLKFKAFYIISLTVPKNVFRVGINGKDGERQGIIRFEWLENGFRVSEIVGSEGRM